MQQPKILIIYTGGTIGMVQEPESKSLKPFDFEHLTSQVPELNRLNCQLEVLTLENIIDSSDMHPDYWMDIAEKIEERYQQFDGFVILHGSDTMAYTASGLSFILENLTKPVILTGSQLPIGVIRTDGKENFLTAIEIAAAKDQYGNAMVPEVAIYFEYKLYRGNRTYKYSAEHFEAFHSPNYPFLAEAGISIKFNKSFISKPQEDSLIVNKLANEGIAILHLFPGIHESVIKATLFNKDIKAVVLKTYGSGNAPTSSGFLDSVKRATEEGKIILNITQCQTGQVVQGLYATSKKLQEYGVVSGKDMTIEAAVSKLMFLFGKEYSTSEIKKYLSCSLRGEMSE